MNNDISIRPSYLTAAAPAEAFAENLGFAQPARISMNNDRFNVLDENGQAVVPPALNINVIMLWENDTRVYYTGVYDPENPAPPACYSDNKVTPSVSAMQPQNDLCATCPRAVWDQPTPRGNLVPACKNQYKVSCLVSGVKGVFLLTIPPASRKAYEQYRKFLRSHNARPEQVITKLDYADKAFQFSFQVWINEQTDAVVKRAFETDEPALIVNAYDKPRATALPSTALPSTALPAPKLEPNTVKEKFDHAIEWGDTIKFTGPAPKPDPIQEEFARQVDNPQETQFSMQGETQFASPPKRRGRPPKPAVSAEPSTPPASALAPKPDLVQWGRPEPGQKFGMEAAQKPPADIQEALNRAFGP